MKQLLSILIAATLAVTSTASYAVVKEAPVKKVAKKHKKAESTTKVADDKPKKSVAKKK
jgi:Na+-transporting methylmalonyl-CoA/oxaloacetate decarboxylase gamma subunit